MHRSSALSQLHWRRNPEKAMIGTVYNARSDTPQSFRYASLSDIIRKALGGHQIAVAQTTHIDRAAGLVNHRAPAHIGGVAFLRLAGLPALGVRSTPPDGGGPDLSPALRPVHDGGDRRRGRSRRSGWRPRSAVTGKGGGHWSYPLLYPRTGTRPSERAPCQPLGRRPAGPGKALYRGFRRHQGATNRGDPDSPSGGH
jgi:hypothetical protein